MIKKLMANLSIKLLSILLAVITWATIMNIVNPIITGYVNLSVNVENENAIHEQNKTYFILDTRSVRVSYRTKTNNQMTINASDFYAYIDLNDIAYVSDMTSNERKVAVQIKSSPDVDNIISNVQVEPSEVKVVIDDVSRNEYKVQYNIVGDVGAGHSVGNVLLSPNIVYVSSSNAVLESIDHIAIDIPVSKNGDETFSGISKIKLYAADNTVLPTDGLMLSAEDIGYSVVLNSTANITLNPIVEGHVESGYNLVETRVTPNSIVIEGPKGFVQNIYSYDLPTINISGLSENKEYKFKLSDILPIGVTSKVNEVTVTVVVSNNVINAPAGSEVGPHIDNENEITESAGIINATRRNEMNETKEFESIVSNEVIESSDANINK